MKMKANIPSNIRFKKSVSELTRRYRLTAIIPVSVPLVAQPQHRWHCCSDLDSWG